MATQYSKITPAAYNNARTQVVGVLGTTTTGTPGATQGYGQSPVSSAVSQYDKITELQLDNLFLDIVQAYTHQNGTAPTITNVAKTDIESAAVFTQYETLASSINANKDTVAPGQVAELLYRQEETYAAYEGTPNTGGGWKNYANYEIKVTFADADKARYFFNAGSSFLFLAARSGGTTSPQVGLDQNASWSYLLELVIQDQPTFKKSNFYALTDTYQQVYIKYSTSSGYTANYYKISAKSNVANNSQGGATEFTFKIEFIDAYNDGNSTNYDGVDGKFTSLVYRYMPKGVGFGGVVTVASPTSVVRTPSTTFTTNGAPIYITAAYSISNTTPATSQDEGAKTFTFAFNATNYNVPAGGNTVTWTVTASTVTGLVDFVETGWTVGPDSPSGYKTITRTTKTTGSYATSSSTVSITTFADNLTEGDETFKISAVGAADGSGGGFKSNELTFIVTDSSKTPTPGITVAYAGGPVIGPSTELSCIPGESYGATRPWTIASSALTGTVGVIVYGLYVDISGASGINAYKLTLPSEWGGTVITETYSTYYTLDTPQTIASGSSVTVTIQVASTSGTAGTVSAVLRVKSNAGSAAGSGPSPAPTYNITNSTFNIQIVQPTISISLSLNPTSLSYYFTSGNIGSNSTDVTVTNNGNARATITTYSVTSPGGTVEPRTLSGVILAGATKTTTITYSSSSAYSGTSQVLVTVSNDLAGTSTASKNIGVTATQAVGIVGSVSLAGVISTTIGTTATGIISIYNSGNASLSISSVSVSTLGSWLTLGAVAGAPSSIAAGQTSSTSTFTWSRSRIGATDITMQVISNSNGGNGVVTSILATLSGSANTPSISMTSNNGAVTNSYSFGTKAIIKKESQLILSLSGAEPNGYWWIAPQWDTGKMHQYLIDVGITTPSQFGPDSANPAPSRQTIDSSGGATAWGTYTDETTYWRTGIGKIWIIIQNGKFDNGTQSYYVNPYNGSGKLNRLDVEIIPNMMQTLYLDTDTLSNLDPGTNTIVYPKYWWSMKGGPSDTTMYYKGSGTSDTNYPGYNYEDPANNTLGGTPLDASGRATMAAGTQWDYGIRTLSRQFKALYNGVEYVSDIKTVAVHSPAFFPLPGGYGWAKSNNSDPADIGTWFAFYRRLTPLVVGQQYVVTTEVDDEMWSVVATDQDGALVPAWPTSFGTRQIRVFTATQTYGLLTWVAKNTGGPGSFFVEVVHFGNYNVIYSTNLGGSAFWG